MDSQEEWWCYESCRDKGSVWPKLCYETTCSRRCVRQPFTVELFVMCQTVFQKFSEEKPRELTKQKKQFSRGIGKQKSAKPKKPRENHKKNNIPEVLGRGGQTRVSKYCFFVFFGFLEVFLVLHFSAFQDLRKIVFFLIFFWFSRGFCSFSKGPSPKILKMSFLICSSRLYCSFVYCYAFFGRNSALMLLFFISFVAFHI